MLTTLCFCTVLKLEVSLRTLRLHGSHWQELLNVTNLKIFKNRPVNSELQYDQFLSKHNIMKLCKFLEKSQFDHFNKIVNDETHYLYNRIPPRCGGKTRRSNNFQLPHSRTKLREKSFFISSALLYNCQWITVSFLNVHFVVFNLFVHLIIFPFFYILV